MTYETELTDHLWHYRYEVFGDRPELFDQPERSGNRPPVFRPEHADLNILNPPDADPTTIRSIRSAIPQ